MNKTAAPLTYITPGGQPVISQQYHLTERETEATEVRDMIVSEGVTTPGKAGLLVTRALTADSDPAFIEWLTCGLLVSDTTGFRFADPAVAEWAGTVAETGKVW